MKKLMTMMLILSSLSIFAGMEGAAFDHIEHVKDTEQAQDRHLDSVDDIDSEAVQEFKEDAAQFSFNEKI
jgi:hypothetical protein